MGEAQSHHQLLLQQPQPPTPRLQPPHSRFAGATTPRAGPGEIVEVQGGHIVRSTGRKDRHSKVCTAKGPRDRRVRLSAHTAIQFYDVQDRLGYDRPSKAVDWLMKNAKAAIDELAELPAWNPTATAITTTTTANPPPLDDAPAAAGDSSKKPMPASQLPTSYGFSVGGAVTGGSSSSFLPPSLDSDAIADTIKSFFPIAAATATTPTQNYPPDLLSRTSSQAQDLRLSLQSFQDPIFHQPQQPTQAPSHHHPHHHAFFSSPAQLAFDGASASWSDQHQRIVPWNVTETGGGGENNSAGGSGGFAFNLPSTAQAVPLHSVLGHGHFFTQRGPLQSSTPPAVRGWADSIAGASDHQMQQSAIHPSIPTIGFSSASGFSGFRIPARIQGEEEHDGMPDKPSSASSGSHH